jgi:hypothetical protein
MADDIRQFEGSWRLLGDLDRTDPPFPTAVTARIWDGARVLTEVWWFASLFSAAGLLLLFTGPPESRRAAAGLLSAWFAVMLGTAMFEGGTAWRYSMEVAPIQWMLGSAGAVVLLSSLWRLVSGRRS